MRTADRFIAWRVLREKDFVKKEYRRAPSSVPCPHAIHLALDIVRQKRYRKSVSAYPLQVGKGRSGTGFKAESTILLRFRAPDASKRGARAYLSRDSYQFLARHVEIRQRKQRIDLRRFNSQESSFCAFFIPFLLLFYSFSTHCKTRPVSSFFDAPGTRTLATPQRPAPFFTKPVRPRGSCFDPQATGFHRYLSQGIRMVRADEPRSAFHASGEGAGRIRLVFFTWTAPRNRKGVEDPLRLHSTG